ncbi:hypothetical protein RYX36_009912, partial [Vicia faba]
MVRVFRTSVELDLYVVDFKKPLERNEDWDEESLAREGDDYISDAAAGDSDDNLHSPLISRQETNTDKDLPRHAHDGDVVQTAALVSKPALYNKDLMHHQPVGPAMIHPSETAAKGPSWNDLFEPGVKHALFCSDNLTHAPLYNYCHEAHGYGYFWQK